MLVYVQCFVWGGRSSLLSAVEVFVLQVKWCCQVFTSVSAANTLVELYADTLRSLDPSFGMCIDAALKQQSDQLTFVMDLRQITKHFAVNLQLAIDSASQGMYNV
jgi:hypothetical protein